VIYNYNIHMKMDFMLFETYFPAAVNIFRIQKLSILILLWFDFYF